MSIILPKTIAKVFVAFLSFLADGFSFRSLGGSFDAEDDKVTLVRLDLTSHGFAGGF